MTKRARSAPKLVPETPAPVSRLQYVCNCHLAERMGCSNCNTRLLPLTEKQVAEFKKIEDETHQAVAAIYQRANQALELMARPLLADVEENVLLIGTNAGSPGLHVRLVK